jgi:hypothetical protein
MKSKGRRVFSLSALALGGLLVGAPLVARASQPTTAQEADQRAEQFTKRAQNYKFQGGALWKTGHVQDAQRSAANCTAIASTMRSGSVAMVGVPSDEALRDSGAMVAVIVPNSQPAPETPQCPAP